MPTTEPGESAGARDPITPPGAVPSVGLVMIVVATFFLGSTWPLIRLGVQLMPPLWYAYMRMAGASLFLFVVLALLGRLHLPSRHDMPAILSVGIGMMGIFVVFAHLGIQWVQAGRATLLVYTVPLWVTPIAVIFLRERLSRGRLAGLVIGLCGLAILFNPLAFDWTSRQTILGNGMLILCSMVWALCIIQMRMQVYRLDPLQLAPWQLLVAAGVNLIAMLLLESDRSVDWSDGDAMTVLVAGMLLTGVTLWTCTSAIRHLPAITSSVGFLGVPVVSLVLSAVFLGEVVGPSLIIGLVVILSGVGMVSVAQVRDIAGRSDEDGPLP